MKRKNLLALIVFIGVLAVIDLPRLMSNCPYYPNTGSCGDPAAPRICNPITVPCTCAQSGCHGGNVAASTSTTLTILIQDSATYIQTGTLSDTLNSSFKYVPGTSYYLAFLLLENSNADTYGFEMTALNVVAPDTTMAGDFELTDVTHTYLQTSPFGIQYLSHHNATVSGFHNWGFQWVAPATSKPITFYYTYNFADTIFLDSAYAGGTGFPGGQIYEGNVTIQSAISGINDIADKVSNVDVFPNPVSDQFNLSFTLKQSNPVSLSVYSVDGKMVQQLMQNETKDAGYFNSSFDISNLAAGIYLAKLSVGGASITKKIIKL